jgi:2,4-dienoyl-CoA reductase (NADPH2)
LIGLGRSLRTDSNWIKKVQEGRKKEIKYCINCNWCLKRVILDQGFNCSQWPKSFQESTDLNHKLLSRMYKGVWVVSDRKDIELLKSALPLFLPDKRRLSITISPTILFLEKDGKPPLTTTEREDFLRWGKEMLQRFGHVDGQIETVDRAVKDTVEKDVNEAIERGNHGLIFLCQNRSQAWRERLLYNARGKVTALIGSNDRQSNILVPVDLSMSTLLALMFICHSYVGKPGLNIDFVHVLRDPSAPVEKRWKELKEIVGWDEDFRLQLIPAKGDVAAGLLEMVRDGNYGTIIMGKRGLSGIKRRLLGSVSASLLRGLSNQTLFLVD